MKLRLQDIGADGASVGLRLEKEWLSDVMSVAGSVNFRAPRAQETTIDAKRSGLDVRLRASFELELLADCASCLEDFALRVPVVFDVTLKPKPELLDTQPNEYELSQKDLDDLFYQGDELDLLEIVREQIILSLPLFPRCRPDCRGLCPQCGANLNTGSCNCRKTDTDPRWKALRDLAGK